MSHDRNRKEEKDKKDKKEEKSHVNPADKDAEFFRDRPLTADEKQKQDIILASTKLPRPLVRIIDGYTKDSLPGKEINLLIRAKELLENCYLEEFKRIINHPGTINYRFNPLIIVLQSIEEHASPQHKFEFVQHLLKNGCHVFLDERKRQGKISPLMLASHQGNAPIVELMLNYEPNICYPSNEKRELQAIDYAMKVLTSNPEAKTQVSPFQDHEKCTKLILQQCFIYGKAFHKEMGLILERWDLDKKNHPNACAMKKCFSKIDFAKVDRVFDAELSPIDFFKQQLEKAKLKYKNKLSLFSNNGLGIEIIHDLERKISAQEDLFKDPKKLYDYLENELKNNPKLNWYCQQEPGNPLAKAFFISEIALRFQQIKLTREPESNLNAEMEKKAPGLE